jgi:dephospho-CoA kinase
MGKRLRDRLGDDIVAKLAFERAKRNCFKKVVFVGARSPGEIEFFRKNIEKFSLVAIESDKAKRFERRAATDGQRMKSFLERDKWELQKFGLGKVIDAADHTIENNSTIDEFQKAIDELMQKI